MLFTIRQQLHRLLQYYRSKVGFRREPVPNLLAASCHHLYITKKLAKKLKDSHCPSKTTPINLTPHNNMAAVGGPVLQ